MYLTCETIQSASNAVCSNGAGSDELDNEVSR